MGVRAAHALRGAADAAPTETGLLSREADGSPSGPVNRVRGPLPALRRPSTEGPRPLDGDCMGALFHP